MGFALEPKDPPPKPTNRLRFSLGLIFLIVLGIGFFAAISTPKFAAARERANTRACYANQKTIVGAVEMYNLDKKTKRTVLDRAFFTTLKSGGYLQSIPDDPGEGRDTSAHYASTEASNGIKCQVHGAIQ